MMYSKEMEIIYYQSNENVNIICYILSFDAFKTAMLYANRCLVGKTA